MALELARTRRHLFGRKAEVVDTDQAQLALDAAWPERVVVPSPRARLDPDPVRGTQKKKARSHGRAVIPEHLPTERIVIAPPDVEPGMIEIGAETSEKIDWRPGSFVRVAPEEVLEVPPTS